MNKDYPFSQIKEAVASSQKILVLLARQPTFDQVASSLSLYLSFEKMGKETLVASPDKMVVGFSHLVGLDKVKTDLSGSDLMITLGYPVDDIEKVFTTNGEKGNLQVVVRVKPGRKPVKRENLSFSYEGQAADLIFTIGARKLEGLGKIYQARRGVFAKTPVINIDNHPQNTSFGKVNLVDGKASSISEMVAALISGLDLPADQDIGSNLILGIRNATENFQKGPVSADTFEAAAMAMRLQGEGRQALLSQERPSQKPSGEPPEEWLEPKIYKGSTLP